MDKKNSKFRVTRALRDFADALEEDLNRRARDERQKRLHPSDDAFLRHLGRLLDSYLGKDTPDYITSAFAGIVLGTHNDVEKMKNDRNDTDQ